MGNSAESFPSVAETDESEFRLYSLHMLGKVLDHTLDLDALLASAMDMFLELTRADAGFIMLMDEKADALVFGAAKGLKKSLVERIKANDVYIEKDVAREITKKKLPILLASVGGPRLGSFFQELLEPLSEVAITECFPLVSSRKLVGLINITEDSFGSIFKKTDPHLLFGTICNRVAVAVENARLHRHLLEQFEKLRRTNEEFRESEQRIHLILDNAVDAIISMNERCIIETFNPAAETVFGYSEEEVLGKNIKMLMPQPYHDEHDGYIANYLRTSEAKIIGIGREVKGLRKDGTIFPMDLGVSELRLGGKSVFIGSLRDITERKTTEAQLQQAQKMEAVGNLTGGIAHDFNNILGIILGNLQLLKRRLKDGDRIRSLIEAAIEATQRGADLTGRLLAFSRRQELDPRVLDMNELVAGMDKMLRRALGEQVEIETTLADGLGHVKADPAQLESALLNLAINARDAMDGGGRLMIETSNAELDKTYVARHPFAEIGPHVCLSVTDTGPGIPEEIREHIFEPFFTTKEVGKGSGLGLSMIYGFVKQSGGHINVYSEDGHGTRFRIYLPRSDKPSTALEAGEAGADDLPGGTETVLLVEDDEQFRRTATLLLEDLGYTVLGEPDGPSALKSLEAHPEVDILFTDMIMPGGLNGHELAERAQELRPGLPVLLTSGYPRDAFSEGRQFPLLSKPYTDVDLAQTLRAVLDGRQEPEK